MPRVGLILTLARLDVASSKGQSSPLALSTRPGLINLALKHAERDGDLHRGPATALLCTAPRRCLGRFKTSYRPKLSSCPFFRVTTRGEIS